MILLCGIPSGNPLAMVAAELCALRMPHRLFNQRMVAQCHIAWSIEGGIVSGTISLEGETIALMDVEAVYLRLMDDRLLPELEGEEPEGPARRHARAFHEALFRWSEIAPARVVNRAEAQGSNGSKPYQAQLIARHGLRVPDTLVTNDPDAVLAFRRTHDAIVFKSLSAVRSIVRPFEDGDLERLELIRWCPVQFQELVPGHNIRVHVVGNQTIATEIVSTHVDYRYARHEGGTAELRGFDLPDDIAFRCVAVTRALGLAFAGIDLKRTPAGEYCCLEVNPSPAFAYFEANTGQKIAQAVARYLAGC